MVASLPPAAVIFLFLLCPRPAAFSSFPPVRPLAFKCAPPRRRTPVDVDLTRSLLRFLTGKASEAGFAASSAGGDRLCGFTQCRPDLPPAACASCLSAAADALLSSLCTGSAAAAGWFVDGCYLHYHPGSCEEDSLSGAPRPHEARSRSNGSYPPGRAVFPAAVGKLLGRLVGDAAGLPSRRGFSCGEASYGDGGARVYGAVECLRSIPTARCRECLAGAAAAARTCCNGKESGLAVAGDCTVRFESHPFLSSCVRPAAIGAGAAGPEAVLPAAAATTTYEEDGEGSGDRYAGLEGKVVAAWFLGVACLAGVAMALWQLRRRVLPSGKVAAETHPAGGEDTEERGGGELSTIASNCSFLEENARWNLGRVEKLSLYGNRPPRSEDSTVVLLR